MTSIWIVAHDAAVAAELAGGAKALGASVSAIVLDENAVPDGGLIEDNASAIADAIAADAPQLVLFSHDTQSRLLAGKVAAHLQTSVRNISGIDIDGGTITITRPLYGGLATATEKLGDKTTVLVVGAGALPESAEGLDPGEIKEAPPAAAAPGCRVIENRAKQVHAVNLTAAKWVVGVGRGFAAEPDLALAQALAAKVGAEVACSRPIAEGVCWLPVERYLGVSGATIKPDVYIAIGISGQVQHMVGVNRSKTIVAINKDKTAPIFANADFGIVGDLYEVLPALTNAF